MGVFVALLVIILARCSSAQVIDKGRCPDVIPVDDFDVHRFAGRWYEVARFYDSAEEGLRCETENYTVKDGYLLSNDSGIGPDGKTYSHLVRIYNVSDWHTGILHYASEDPVTYWIPFIDYEKYSINYVCKEYLWGLVNVQNTWILARYRTMSEGDYDEVMKKLTSMGINVKKIKKSDQRNCPIYRDRHLPRT